MYVIRIVWKINILTKKKKKKRFRNKRIWIKYE